MKFAFHPEALFEFEAAADFTRSAKRDWKSVSLMRYPQPSKEHVKHRRGGDFSMGISDVFLSMSSRMLFSTQSRTDFFASLQ